MAPGGGCAAPGKNDGGGVPLPAGQFGSAVTWNPGRTFRFGVKVRF